MGTKTGTREWSEHSFNCVWGCEHACLYCYARHWRFNTKRGADWAKEELRTPRVKKFPGVVMFPTRHDFTKGNIFHCLSYLTDLMDKGNQVLIVTKAGLEIAGQVVDKLCRYPREQSEIRFTLSHVNPGVRLIWEPNAPTLKDRLDALTYAKGAGLRTSISCEPWLDTVENLLELLFHTFSSVTETIWIGHANKLRERTAWIHGIRSPWDQPRLDALDKAINAIEARQTPEAARQVYEALKGNPKVRWKDSYQKILGITADGREWNQMPGQDNH